MTDVTIEIEYGDRFRQQVEDGSADPLTIMDVYVDGEQVKDGDSFISRTVAELLEVVGDIFADEKQVIEYTGGPTYLVFEPRDEETMFVTGCGDHEAAYNPDKRLSVDTTAIVDKQVWVAELVRVAEEHFEKIVELNPDLRDDAFLQRIQSGITNAKQYLDTLGEE